MYDELALSYADYEAHDNEVDTKWQWFYDRLPWMATVEIEKLKELRDFPGFFADYSELSDFVERYKRGKTRFLPCRVRQASFTVSAQIDLVSGSVYLNENGRYRESNVTGHLDIEYPSSVSYYPTRFQARPRIFSARCINGHVEHLDSRSMRDMLDALAQARKLPAL
jgi:hypothetical protein